MLYNVEKQSINEVKARRGLEHTFNKQNLAFMVSPNLNFDAAN